MKWINFGCRIAEAMNGNDLHICQVEQLGSRDGREIVVQLLRNARLSFERVLKQYPATDSSSSRARLLLIGSVGNSCLQ